MTLSKDKITQNCKALNITTNFELEILQTVDSTNTYLKKLNPKAPYIILAEQQTNGRGRGNNIWHSPKYKNIYLSLAWEFPTLSNISILSILVGISLHRSINKYLKLDLPELKIKWPNDIYYKDKKLAGILVETTQQTKIKCIIGIGINFYQDPSFSSISVDEIILSKLKLDRNTYIAYLLKDLFTSLTKLTNKAYTLPSWKSIDLLYNKLIQVNLSEDSILQGIALGTNKEGALLLKTKDKVLTLHHAFNIKLLKGYR